MLNKVDSNNSKTHNDAPQESEEDIWSDFDKNFKKEEAKDEWSDFDKNFVPEKDALESRNRSKAFNPNIKSDDVIIDAQISAFLGTSNSGTRRGTKELRNVDVGKDEHSEMMKVDRNGGGLEDDLLNEFLSGKNDEGFEKNAATQEDVIDDQISSFLNTTKSRAGTLGPFTSSRPRK